MESNGAAASEQPTPEEAEEHMRELLADAGLAEPDEVRHEPDFDELHLYWHEQKLVVIVELDQY